MEGPSGSSVRRKRRRVVCSGILGVSSGRTGEGDEVEEEAGEEAEERVGAEGVEGGTGDKAGGEGEL